MNPCFSARLRHSLARLRRGFARGLYKSGVVAVLLAGLATPGIAALREPPPLTRDQVRSGLAERSEQMRIRQERHNRRREGGGRYNVNPSGRPDFRIPRDPRPVPPPEALQ